MNNFHKVTLKDVFQRKHNKLMNLFDDLVDIYVDQNWKEYEKANLEYENAKKIVKELKNLKPTEFDYDDQIAIRNYNQEIVNKYEYLINQERMKQSPWDDLDELVKKPSELDDIINEIQGLTETEKEQRREASRKKQVAYEKMKQEKINRMKKTRKDLKDYPRLNNLYQTMLDKHENKEYSSLFDFEVPVEGTKYDIDIKGGSVFIPLLHVKVYNELPLYLGKYLKQVVSQIVENIPGTIHFANVDCYALFADPNGTYERPAFMLNKERTVPSINHVNDFCKRAVDDLMNFYDNQVCQKSGLSFVHG
ncbi:MAG TPA: hypothetical protein PLS50_07930, partial [Candidatus Dojkabacteria bacterium]|nr:hypothetical protein [Candidatus Dojkabacteria bacterium]